MPTQIPYGSKQANKIYSAGLFGKTSKRRTKLGALASPFPDQSKAESALRSQTSSDTPVVRCRDLEKKAGDEILFDFVNPLNGKPIMGDNMAEGRGEAMSFSQDRLRVEQTRKPVSAGSVMTQQRTPIQLRKLAYPQAERFMNTLDDNLCITHMAGARGFHNTADWILPLAADEDFSKICVNAVKAPTFNRHFLATSDGVEPINASGSEIGIATTDLCQLDTVDAIKTIVDEMPLGLTGCQFPGDQAASDDPLFVLMVSPKQYMSFKQSGNFREYQSNARTRASKASGHPLFTGDVGLWENILIVKMPLPIRFYSGDPIVHCTSATNATEITTDLVPAAFSTTYAVDRAILMGAQALGDAYGKHVKSGNPYFWSEKMLDHDDKAEILVGMINGKSKIRFEYDLGAEGKQPTDNGVIAIDTAVKL